MGSFRDTSEDVFFGDSSRVFVGKKNISAWQHNIRIRIQRIHETSISVYLYLHVVDFIGKL